MTERLGYVTFPPGQQSKTPPTYTSLVGSTPALFFRIFLVVEPQHAADPRDITDDHAGVIPLRWQAKILPRI
jgi:hypothetical protein